MGSINFITLFVVIPLGTAFLMSLVGRFASRRYVSILSVLSCASLLFVSFWALQFLNKTAGNILVYKIGGWMPPFGICFVVDSLTSFMLVLVNTVAFFVCVYSVSYVKKNDDAPKFFTLFFMMLTGINGVVITGDLFNLYVFLEAASIASYALVAFNSEAEELEASFKYTIIGCVASGFILLGIAFLYSYTSTLNMADMSSILATKSSGFVLPFVATLFITGFGLKAALVPFHAWLPDAHSSAPASISAMLSGVLIKTLGIYAMLRILFNIFGIIPVYLSLFMFLGVLSLLVSGVLALSQWNLKRLLAYSSIGQVGYIILGIGIGTPLGILGALFHLFQHSISKSLLFLTSGSIDRAANTLDIRHMSGLKEKMPLTAGANLAGSMSVSGIPPFGGFFSKLIIIVACVQKGFYIYALAAILGSVFTLIAMLKVQKFIFSEETKKERKDIKEAPFLMQFSMVCLAFICLFAGLLLLPSTRIFFTNAAGVLLGGLNYGHLVLEAAAK